MAQGAAEGGAGRTAGWRRRSDGGEDSVGEEAIRTGSGAGEGECAFNVTRVSIKN